MANKPQRAPTIATWMAIQGLSIQEAIPKQAAVGGIDGLLWEVQDIVRQDIAGQHCKGAADEGMKQ